MPNYLTKSQNYKKQCDNGKINKSINQKKKKSELKSRFTRVFFDKNAKAIRWQKENLYNTWYWDS